MKKTIVALMLSAVVLSGCVTASGNAPAPVVPAPSANQVADVINKVQATTTKLCKFVPTANTVANILAALRVGDYTQLTGVAQQICDAVVKKSMIRSGAPRPSVAGVPVQGRFVK